MNDLKKEFVPYQQSLDMKELGFDEPCLGLYHNDKTFYPTQCKSHEEYHGQVCSTPLYQQAFRWFRKKYKIRFFLQSGMSDLGEFFKIIFPDGEQRGVSYPTYEEAEFECLIKLIEIVKSGSLKA